MFKIKEQLYSRLSPKQISWLTCGGFVFGLFIIILITTPEDKAKEDNHSKYGEIENILINENTRKYSLQAMQDNYRSMQRSQLELEKENEKLRNEYNGMKEKIISSAVLTDEVKRLKKELSELTASVNKSDNEEALRIAKSVGHILNEANIASELDISSILPVESHVEREVSELKKTPPAPKVSNQNENKTFIYTRPTKIANNTDDTLIKPSENDPVYEIKSNSELPSISRSYRGTITDARTEQMMIVIEDEKVKSPPYSLTLPTGTIMSGVLLTGVNVPTSQSAFDNPMPVLFRIKNEAIMPNFNSETRIEECFGTLGGYGDLSSRRAYFRGNTLSCITEDKIAIDLPLEGYVVGEDGKAGLHGRLVSKSQEVLINSMLSGAGSGLASAFNVSPVPVISTDSTGKQQYDSVFSPDALQGGAAKGASQAFEKLADYWMKLADAQHPVIEIGAMREIDFVLTRGISTNDAK
ncbi:TraB/VirB10 family protein [Photobacterium aquae]|uniref:TraB/VirB10 family protein n=1 Tax=Photobacterium aquae TaxID=1195763 RepID=UPI00069D8E8D|nr:TraB/VirB10 family protein [Photobacterium aquae]